jgi:hypothetical protein
MGHTNMVSSKRSEDPITPKMNITNLVTSFMYLKLEVTNPSLEKKCKEIVNGTKNSETWWGKNQARCHVVQVVYLEMLEKTMERLGIEEEKLHIGTMYPKVDELNTTKFDKMGVNNKEMVTNNHNQKLVPKIRGQRIDYENGINKHQFLKWCNPKMVTKEGLSKAIMKKQLRSIIITIERGVIVSNSYLKIIKIVANGLQTITKRSLTLKVFSYLNTSTIHVPPTDFLSHYVISIVRCSFPFLLCPLSYSLLFISGPMLI